MNAAFRERLKGDRRGYLGRKNSRQGYTHRLFICFGFLKPDGDSKADSENHDAKLLIAENADICQWQTDELTSQTWCREETGCRWCQ